MRTEICFLIPDPARNRSSKKLNFERQSFYLICGIWKAYTEQTTKKKPKGGGVQCKKLNADRQSFDLMLHSL